MNYRSMEGWCVSGLLTLSEVMNSITIKERMFHVSGRKKRMEESLTIMWWRRVNGKRPTAIKSGARMDGSYMWRSSWFCCSGAEWVGNVNNMEQCGEIMSVKGTTTKSNQESSDNNLTFMSVSFSFSSHNGAKFELRRGVDTNLLW